MAGKGCSRPCAGPSSCTNSTAVTSFDGHPIESPTSGCAYNDFQAPHIVKRYRKLLLEVDSVFRASFTLASDFDDDREVGVPAREVPYRLWSGVVLVGGGVGSFLLVRRPRA